MLTDEQAVFATEGGEEKSLLTFCGKPLSAFTNVILGTEGDDVLIGTDGPDLIRGFGGNDLIIGNGGDDCLIGGAGDDEIFGNEGNDIMYGMSGNDRMYGGPGNDRMFGDSGDDELYGHEGDDAIWGGDGNDIAYGGPGNDKLVGDLGNDTLFGHEGDDEIWGGEGDDIMYGGPGNDKIIGDAGNDFLSGNDGDDVLLGEAGDDTLAGGAGNDGLFGKDDDDFLYDELGDDLLNGGNGIDDKCFDPSGANKFVDCEDISRDQQDDSAFADFDIKNFGIDGGKELFMEVYGNAGGTIPDKPEQALTVYVYVFNTDNGIWVINAHQECHTSVECGVSEWHTEKVDVGQIDGDTCVTQIYVGSERAASMEGAKAKTLVPEATQINSVQTMSFELQTNDPDNSTPGTCIAKLMQVFDDTNI